MPQQQMVPLLLLAVMTMMTRIGLARGIVGEWWLAAAAAAALGTLAIIISSSRVEVLQEIGKGRGVIGWAGQVAAAAVTGWVGT
jgi:hypothetical protein